MDSSTAFDQLKSQVEGWVSSLADWTSLPKGPLPGEEETRVVRDAVTGYQALKPYEYLLLDTPLLQRLRYIHQTALAYLVYPSANHTRFEHSLGCAKIAQQLGERVIIPRDNTAIAKLRLAALLHDVGHTFFSHLSECIMQSHFRELYDGAKKAAPFAGLDLSLGEIISYLIVKSDPFDAFLRRVVNPYEPTLDVDDVSKMIIHRPAEEQAFMGDIISGPFDVDKLDYLVRDCYFCGIRADVDVERVVVSAALLNRVRFPSSDGKWRRRYLVMRSGGVSVLEQIIFNRMLLFPAIYHHHKIRAIECMIKSIFEIIWDDLDNITNPSLKFENIAAFFRLTDSTFLAAAESEPALGAIVKRLLNRDLLKRCLVIARPYLTRSDKFMDLLKVSYEDSPEELRRIRDIIYGELPVSKRGRIQDLWVDLPKRPSLGKDAERAFVDIGTKQMKTLDDFFPYPQWVTSYEVNKWKGHVFSSGDGRIRGAVNKVAQDVLRRGYDMEFDERATTECKLN